MSPPTDRPSAVDGAPDRALAERFRSGEEPALRELYDRWGGPILRIGTVALGPADAEDLVQQVFLRAWHGRHSYDADRGAFGSWLLGITRRQIADVLASRGRHRRSAAALGALAPVPTADVPESVVNRVTVGAGLDRLPPGQQDLLRLAFYDGLSHAEIACVTGLPVGTVKSAIRRGLLALRADWEVGDVAP